MADQLLDDLGAGPAAPVWPAGVENRLIDGFRRYLTHKVNVYRDDLEELLNDELPANNQQVHELETILAELRGNVDLLQRGELPNRGIWLEDYAGTLNDNDRNALQPYIQQLPEEEPNNNNMNRNNNNNRNLNNHRRWENDDENNDGKRDDWGGENNNANSGFGGENRRRNNRNNENNPLGRIRVNRPETTYENVYSYLRVEPRVSFEEGKELAFKAPSAPVTEIKAYKEKVEQKLVDCFLETYKQEFDAVATPESFLTWFRALLKESGAVIAGGFLLLAAGIFKPGFDKANTDMDIYVNCKKLTPFNLQLAKLLKGTEVRQFNATFYCLSFLRKNGIRSVQTISNRNELSSCSITNIDIMSVRNSRNVLDVVKNFDLTFCQIWYDGDGVFATHPEHIYNRVGLLQKDYVPLYFNGNGFLKKRIEKYKGRGFRVYIDNESAANVIETHDPLKRNSCERRKRDEEYYKKYVQHTFLRWITGRKYKISSYKHSKGKVAINIAVAKRGSGDYHTIENYTSPLHETDGYDSEEMDIESQDIWQPLIEKATGPEGKFSEFADLEDDESKFWHIASDCLLHFKSLKQSDNPLLWNFDIDEPESTYEEFEQMTANRIKDYFMNIVPKIIEAFDKYLRRIDMDPITLDDVPVYDIHKHTKDQATSQDSMISYINSKEDITDKIVGLPCYEVSCRQLLTASEISAILPFDDFKAKMKPPRPAIVGPQPNRLLADTNIGGTGVRGLQALVSISEILQDKKTRTDGWGEIYHRTVCPFCLTAIGRDAGCAYVAHDNPSALPYRFMPYCKMVNIVPEFLEKYKRISNLRGEVLEVCIECGRPCSSHQHFDFNDPPGFVPPRLEASGGAAYGLCPGGGRRELIARILGIRQAIHNYHDLDATELRKRAAFEAEEAAQDEAMLARADRILAKADRDRSNRNLNTELGIVAPAPAPEGAPNADAPETQEGGRKKRIGHHGCPDHDHVVGSYKGRIASTRKNILARKSRNTRKNE